MIKRNVKLTVFTFNPDVGRRLRPLDNIQSTEEDFTLIYGAKPFYISSYLSDFKTIKGVAKFQILQARREGRDDTVCLVSNSNSNTMSCRNYIDCSLSFKFEANVDRLKEFEIYGAFIFHPKNPLFSEMVKPINWDELETATSLKFCQKLQSKFWQLYGDIATETKLNFGEEYNGILRQILQKKGLDLYMPQELYRPWKQTINLVAEDA